MYLKEKHNGTIKAHGCADGHPQRLYKTKSETSSPTVLTEAIFLTALIDAQEGREVMTVDIPGAFMQSDMDELVHVKLEGPMAKLLAKVDPGKYHQYIAIENGRTVFYVELAKVLYGTLQAALLFWQNLSGFLIEELGFTVNKFDKCVTSKIINGNQCTICWHIDDLKMSHVKADVLEDIVKKLDVKYGSDEAPLTVMHGKIHDYLGMTLDYSVPSKATFTMHDYIKNLLLDEAPADMEGTAATPAANSLFTINDDAEKLDGAKSDQYHCLTMKLLYLCKRVRVDIQTAVAFLMTCTTQPDVDDWKKLSQCI
jgi:hypothetical protein